MPARTAMVARVADTLLVHSCERSPVGLTEDAKAAVNQIVIPPVVQAHPSVRRASLR
jgi:hypothetical protein